MESGDVDAVCRDYLAEADHADPGRGVRLAQPARGERARARHPRRRCRVRRAPGPAGQGRDRACRRHEPRRPR
ncbi:hypothetical protein [Pseudonocardia sp. KRD291]|uniref:hypothetical protein n=1 Tax=Pseudonocardia sp. KRD291 TaxID=2792007 RepID=UPI0035AF0255